MIKTKQLIHDKIKGYKKSMTGDCWRACVASFLELPIENVPHFAQIWNNESIDKAMHIYIKLMAENGWVMRVMDGKAFKFDIDNCKPQLIGNESPYYFVTGKSPRNAGLHMTIWKDGKLVHDPHPDNTGIKNVEYVELMIPNTAYCDLKANEMYDIGMATKMTITVWNELILEELIKAIKINPANLDHISKTGNINGSLYLEIKRIVKEYLLKVKDETSETQTELQYIKEKLTIAFEGRKYDSSWMYPKAIGMKERFANIHEALLTVEKIIRLINFN